MNPSALSACILLLLLGSCQSHVAPPQTSAQLVDYANDQSHGLVSTTSVKGVQVKVAYQPVELLVLRELNATAPRKSLLDSLEKKYKPYQYFLVSLSRDKGEVLNPELGQEKYGQLLQTLAFGLTPYVNLTTSKGDTLKSTSYFLERSYNMQSSTQLLIVFPQVVDTEWMQFNLKEFGLNTGDMKFRFSSASIAAVPKLN